MKACTSIVILLAEVRFKGKFDTNLILFVGGSVRYVF